jgi:hypothetical protein
MISSLVRIGQLMHKRYAGGAVQLLLLPENITINSPKKRMGKESVRTFIKEEEEAEQSQYLHPSAYKNRVRVWKLLSYDLLKQVSGTKSG